MEIIKKQFSNKSFTFFSKTSLAEETKVTLTLPNLQNSNLSMWSDWGPMYKFKLNAEDRVKISYNEKSCELSLQDIEILSPVSFEQRKSTPLSCQIDDKDRGCSFCLYFDANLNLASVDTYLSSGNSCHQEFTNFQAQQGAGLSA